jgi:hypothetical protein
MRIIECDQYSPEWWDARCGIPTASCADKIITSVKGDLSSSAPKYACELIAQKYDAGYGVVEPHVTSAMRNGRIMEPESRRFYELERDCDVTPVGFCVTDDGRFGASPDALCGDDGSLELKNPTARVQVEYLVNGKLPDDYKPQLHFQLLVTQRKWVDFMSYHPGLPPLLLRVYPDEYTLKVARAMESFWKLYQELRAKITGAGDPVAANREPYTPPF